MRTTAILRLYDDMLESNILITIEGVSLDTFNNKLEFYKTIGLDVTITYQRNYEKETDNAN